MNLFPSDCYFLALLVYAQESGGWEVPGVKAGTKLLRKFVVCQSVTHSGEDTGSHPNVCCSGIQAATP